MRKKFFLLLLALSLTGCGSKESVETESVELVQETETETEESEETISEEELAEMEREAQLDRFADTIKKYKIEGSSCKIETCNQSVIEFNEVDGAQNLRILLYNGDEIEAVSYLEEGATYFNVSKNDAVTMIYVKEPVDFMDYITVPSFVFGGDIEECEAPNVVLSKDKDTGIEYRFTFDDNEEMEKVEYKVYDYDEKGHNFSFTGPSEYIFSPDISQYQKSDLTEIDKEILMFVLNVIN